MWSPKSLYRSRVGCHFYGTKYDIWADFGLVGITEKKIEASYEQLLRLVSSCFLGQKNRYFEKERERDIVLSTL